MRNIEELIYLWFVNNVFYFIHYSTFYKTTLTCHIIHEKMFEKVEYFMMNMSLSENKTQIHEKYLRVIYCLTNCQSEFWEVIWLMASNIAGPNNLVTCSKPNPQIQSQIKTKNHPLFKFENWEEKKEVNYTRLPRNMFELHSSYLLC